MPPLVLLAYYDTHMRLFVYNGVVMVNPTSALDPCFGFMKAQKCLVFKEEFWKASIVTNTIWFSLDFLKK